MTILVDAYAEVSGTLGKHDGTEITRVHVNSRQFKAI